MTGRSALAKVATMQTFSVYKLMEYVLFPP